MMVKPSVEELLERVDNRFELVVTTAKRARQLSNGDKARTDKKEASAVTLAADEIAEGNITIAEEPEEDEEVEDVEE